MEEEVGMKLQIKHTGKRNRLLGRKGQVAVEYLLIILTVAALIVGFGSKLRNFLVGPTGECPSDALFCKIIKGITGQGALGGDFRYFSVRR